MRGTARLSLSLCRKMKNPIRRSRNIGKTQGGRVKDGRAQEKWSRLYPENKWRQISDEGTLWNTFIENPSRDYYHPCTPEEYFSILKQLPGHHTDNVKGIILRRTPKRDLKFGIEAWRRWSCVIMNPFPKSNKYVFDKQPNNSLIKFFQPFCTNWSQENEKWILSWTHDQARRYYLYQVFLHEIGHINDGTRTTKRKRENYADSFAREMAEWLLDNEA